MNLIPLLPPDQNARLFGTQQPAKPPSPEGAQAILTSYEVRGLLEGIPELEDAPQTEWEETRTWLPDWSDKPGPRAALSEGLQAHYATPLAALGALVSMDPVEPPANPTRLPGWVRYPHDGSQPTQVPHPLEDGFLFDTETFVQGGNHPLMATAVSPQAWYVWLNPTLAAQGPLGPLDTGLIPLGPGKLFVAHNALFDMSKVAEAYSLSQANRPMAFCTMAAHGAVSTTGGDQALRAFKAIPQGARPEWAKRVCGDSLRDTLEFYTGRQISKDARDLFVKGSLQEIQDNLGPLLAYALNDTYETHWLLLGVWPQYREAVPSLLNLCGGLELSRTLLPIHPSYPKRLVANNAYLEAKRSELVALLETMATQALDAFHAGQTFGDDPWLSQLDWTPAKTGKNKGQPAWWRKTKGKLSLGAMYAPLLARVTWHGNPLSYDKKRKWGFYEDGVWDRLPHKDGAGKNVGNPFGKDFKAYAESGVLGSELPGNIPLELANLSYWVSYQSRFAEEYVRQLACGYLGIVPVTKLCGTLTGRQVQRLWLTAAQTKKGKLGSDMTHCIQAPEGFRIVAFDIDTEEMRIGALWGDKFKGMGLGATALSQVAFRGHKDRGNDNHTLTAKLADISRQDAKVANFRDLFGGGRVTQANALRSSHPDWPTSKIDQVVSKILDAKRGTKVRGQYQGGTDSDYHNQAATIANTPHFRLPTTGRKIPKVVDQAYDSRNEFYTSRYNFPVQGTGADILAIIACTVPLIAKEWGISMADYGYIMARHDEIAYLVKDQDGLPAWFAELLHSVHAIAWACVMEGMGFNWMPSALARVSGVSIDWVYRKSVDAPIDAGYGFGFSGPDGYEVK